MKISDNGKELTMRVPDNWHVHFRQGPMLPFIVGLLLKYGWRGRAVAEPNTLPPKLTDNDALEYYDEITSHADGEIHGKSFEPVVTIQITESTTPKKMWDAHSNGVRVCKVYPRYVTTHSENGVSDYFKIYPALAEAQEFGMVVQFHGEHPSYDVIGRHKESAFRTILDEIRKYFPTLRISVEHVSSRDMVEWVKGQPENVGAGITVQHLYLTSDDLAGYSKRSGGLVCLDDGAFKPGAKDPEDRDAIREVILSGHPRFWAANDDAWHPKSKKHTSRCACGVGNTIASLPLTLSFFEEHGKLELAEPFLSEFGAHFYGFKLNEGEVTFRKEEWEVPREIPVPGLNDSVTPFFAGEKMQWKLVD